MSEHLKVRSLSDTDTSVYEMDAPTAGWLVLEWDIHNAVTPDLPFRDEVTILEDGERKVYAVSNERHAGFGLKVEFINGLPPLWLEFVRSAP